MVLDAALINTQHYKVGIKDKMAQSREGSSTLLHLGVVAFEKGALGSPSTKVANFTFLYIVVGPKREIDILKCVGPRRDLYFLRIYSFISFLHTYMFPACCFRQRTYMAQGLVNGVLNETGTHLCLQFELFSVDYGFI